MATIGTTQPDSDPGLQRLMVSSRVRLGEGLIERERVVELASAIAFLLVALALVVVVEPTRQLDLGLAIAMTGLYALGTRVEFQMGATWTDPSQLMLVPMFFLLPTEMVPAFVAFGMLISRLPDYLSGGVHVDRAINRIADAIYSIAPTVVLLAAGATEPQWSLWPVFVLAFAAQLAFDAATTWLRIYFATGAVPAKLFDEVRATYLVDALLAPVGLLVAVEAARNPATILVAVPLFALVALFARERVARIESAFTLSSAYQGTAELLGEVLSTSDEYTGSHSRSVLVLAHQVAERLGLDELEIREVEYGSLLHDIGKLAIPNEIINKPGKLTPEEMDVMRTHTLKGAAMLARIGGVLGEAGHVIRGHHENFDGSGYPDGLRGEEIPIASRVISACDAFNAMTTDRPYRSAMSIDEAVVELRACSGTQFDPAVTEALIACVTEWEDRADRGLVGPMAEAG